MFTYPSSTLNQINREKKLVSSWQLFSPGWRLSWVEVSDGDLENLENKGKY